MRAVPHALRVQGASPEGFKLKAAERHSDLGGHGAELLRAAWTVYISHPSR
ncbi:hypothetical protein MKK65_08265 [Methylobacterium sp. J-001]|uniref:hypothetical protein n=1 Tax=Methylobacterium sp. J-001 TaxID=2836609 RepID=UPI001FBB5D0B|nr:hypothetical protein [Methylobacterium sp. J-001]MCJ2116573.1 hypothetical protein [Methylobacterium sp. J-001]